MAKFNATFRKASRGQRAAAPKAHAPGDPVPGIVYTDNDDSTCTVTGLDNAGADVDLSGVATLSVTSSDPTTTSVDVNGMTFTAHGQKPGHADLTVTVTANDGSFGPFTSTIPADASTGPAGSIKVTIGTPTPRP